MTPSMHELPRQVVRLLKTVGPVWESASATALFTVRVVLRGDDEVAGFLVEERLAERQPEAPVSASVGMSFPIPARAARGEATLLFTDTLPGALRYIEQRSHAPG